MKKIIFLLFLVLFTNLLVAQRIDPLKTSDFQKQEIWVDSILKNMTIDEKIGQLFMMQAYSNSDKKHEDFISELITKYHVGNLIFMQGTPEKQAVLTNKLVSFQKQDDKNFVLNQKKHKKKLISHKLHTFEMSNDSSSISQNVFFRKCFRFWLQYYHWFLIT